MTPEKVLVCMPNNLGDVIMTLPVVYGLQHSGAEVFFLVEEGSESPLQGIIRASCIITIPRALVRDTLRGKDWQNGITLLKDLVAQLESHAFDRIINLCQIEYISRLVGLLDTAKVQGRYFAPTGLHVLPDFWSTYLYAIPAAREANRLHATDIYRRIAGVKFHHGNAGLAVSSQEGTALREKLTALGVPQRFVVLHPGAAWESKRWPIEHFRTLATMLISDAVHVLLTGSAQEYSLCDSIAQVNPSKITNCAGAFSFRESITAVSFASCVISGDTAIMHASAGVSTPVIALFGPTSPRETGPYGNGHFVLHGTCSQSPCFNKTCRTQHCMRSIAPSQVYALCKKQYTDTGDCAVYKTLLLPDSDYALIAHGSTQINLCHEALSTALCQALGESPFLPTMLSPEYVSAVADIAFATTILNQMAQALESLLLTSNPVFMHAFKKHQEQLTTMTGCAAFIRALLDLELSSIVYSDSLEALAHTIKSLQQLSARFHLETHQEETYEHSPRSNNS